MKKLWMTVSIGSLFAVAGLAESLSGTITDASCGAKHEAASESDIACAQRCVKRGSAPVFVSSGKVYQISADSREKVKDVIGHKGTVEGKIDGETVSIQSVEAAK